MQHECSIKPPHSRYEAAMRDYEKSKELDPNDAGYYNQAICLLYLGRYEEAINNLNKSIELNPNAASRYYHKGQCLYKLKRLEESRIALEKAVKLRPYYGIAKHNRNILNRKLGR